MTLIDRFGLFRPGHSKCRPDDDAVDHDRLRRHDASKSRDPGARTRVGSQQCDADRRWVPNGRLVHIGTSDKSSDQRHHLHPPPAAMQRRTIGHAQPRRRSRRTSERAQHSPSTDRGHRQTVLRHHELLLDLGQCPNPAGCAQDPTSVTKVTLSIAEPETQTGNDNYNYSLVGVSTNSSSSPAVTTTTVPSSYGCNFAAAGSGAYATQLCFADFTGFNNTIYSATDKS